MSMNQAWMNGTIMTMDMLRLENVFTLSNLGGGRGGSI
jgi:hypothetical protein